MTELYHLSEREVLSLNNIFSLGITFRLLLEERTHEVSTQTDKKDSKLCTSPLLPPVGS